VGVVEEAVVPWLFEPKHEFENVPGEFHSWDRGVPLAVVPCTERLDRKMAGKHNLNCTQDSVVAGAGTSFGSLVDSTVVESVELVTCDELDVVVKLARNYMATDELFDSL
jgi:hypothetical protein